MELSGAVLLASLALFLCITGNSAAGWKCHICDSAKNPDCGDNDKFVREKVPAEDCNDACIRNRDYKPAAASNNVSAATQPVPSNFPRICPPADKYRLCRKIKISTTVHSINEGKAVDKIVRMCGYEGENSTKEYEYTSGAAYKREVFNCYNAPECNAGAPVVWSFSITLGLLLVLLAVKF